jgi:prepilin-type N-terminal cleavage/methylation domain-containing protein
VLLYNKIGIEVTDVILPKKANSKTIFTCRCAFTIIEILIVITIIAIMAGIFLLSSGAATEKAKKTTCLGDRRTIEREYVIRKANDITESSADIIADIMKARGTKVDSGTGLEYKNICPSKGTYTFTQKDNGVIQVTCSLHTDEVTTASGGSNTYNGIDFNGNWNSTLTSDGSHHYRTASTGDKYHVGSNYYVVYNGTLFNASAFNDGSEWQAALSIATLAAQNAGIVRVGSNVGSYTSSYSYAHSGASFNVGDLVTYNSDTYVCTKDVSSASSSNKPDYGGSTKSWYKIN